MGDNGGVEEEEGGGMVCIVIGVDLRLGLSGRGGVGRFGGMEVVEGGVFPILPAPPRVGGVRG